ncbi:hypothetical protein BUALT_Bualt19G0048700 [Buddleja alternifolia]|uniref:Zinc finger GRF-type domain-containing protein n=1 Tax=Buddleja alternifolia TaxID=168488 RepID=A0AAV6W774_9LAMI|nr:hypothetical protein BUALT_Bualt19G0048700 [Buddleja alternifolia]
MDPPRCDCRIASKLQCAWTNANKARRLYGCELYGQVGECRYFVWFDPPMCVRSRHVIPGLLRSLRRVETELHRVKTEFDSMETELHRVETKLHQVETELDRVGRREKRVWRALVVACLLLLWLLFGSGKSNVETLNGHEMKQLM